MKFLSTAAATVCLLSLNPAQAVSLTSAGYLQNFNGIGIDGTTLPAGWSVFNGEAGTDAGTWTTGIVANGASGSVASMAATNAPLTNVNIPTGASNTGYNAARDATHPADRVLASSPASGAGTAFELSLVNEVSLGGFQPYAVKVSFDTIRYSATAVADELPGYQLFCALDNGPWTLLARPGAPFQLADVPNSVGVSVNSGTFNIGSGVGVGQTLRLRWVDDNASQSDPDQILGLDNVSVALVPEPATAAMLSIGCLSLLLRRR